MWDFAWIADPTAWGGLLALIIIEVVLGIDNIVFISILSSKLPPNQRRRAFVMGLSGALLARLVLLSTMAWIVGLITPLFTLFGKEFSARDIIFLVGGIFLLLKGTMELHERLEGSQDLEEKEETNAIFWQVITQIVVLDAIFSIDSVITSVGMVRELPLMMLAVIIAVGIMLLASAPLARFVDRHPTVIILCLGFLLMIGLSLILDGLGFHVPKSYLYAAIGFSVLVEAFNQLALRNRRNRITTRGLRESAARAVLELLGGTSSTSGETEMEVAALSYGDKRDEVFGPEERAIVARVIRFGGRTVRYIMTPRHRVQWLDQSQSQEEILKTAGQAKHSFLPVLCGDTDEVLGVVDLRELLWQKEQSGTFSLDSCIHKNVPILFEHLPLPDVLDAFRLHPAPMGIVLDEYGTAVGIVTPTDILAVIAGHMGEVANEPEEYIQADGSWLLPGRLAVDDALHALDIQPEEECSCATLAGLLLERFGHIPAVGETLAFYGHQWEVFSMDKLRINQIRVVKLPEEESPAEA